ncbi:hypothetical protein BC830DRAFT_682728 [Chytriomyces sp. MP71]|nr:hypothetical protein BC830DRAFT_682728 [Chytriomyces sp. MP71]
MHRLRHACIQVRFLNTAAARHRLQVWASAAASVASAEIETDTTTRVAVTVPLSAVNGDSVTLSLPSSASGIRPTAADFLREAKRTGASLDSDIVLAIVDGSSPLALSQPLPLHKSRSDAEAIIPLAFGTLSSLQNVTSPFRDSVASAYWHSAAHLLGWAMEEHYGDTLLLDDGPPLSMQGRVGGGFFYDGLLISDRSLIGTRLKQWSLDRDSVLEDSAVAASIAALVSSPTNVFHASNGDLEAIGKIMNALAAGKSRFESLVIPRPVAQDMFAYSPLKLSLLSRIPKHAKLTVYKCGDFIDLCRGPHIPHTGYLGASQLLKTASATISPSLLASSSSTSSVAPGSPLSRIYGITFPRPKQLTQWIADQEEALQRDHRLIGKQQALFAMHPMSAGSAFMLPHGTRIAHRLMEFVRAQYRICGYHEVVTPLIFNKELWVTSGHWENYREDMFLVEGGGDVLEREAAASAASVPAHDHTAEGCGHGHGEDVKHGLKPMNCPGHCLVFANKSYSYRELPVRLAEFSPLHRNEASGALTGLTRVRKFHQDDAHIFCTQDQIQSEISSTLAFISKVYTALQFPEYALALSTRPLDKSIGTQAQWDVAEIALRNALDAAGRPYTIKEGDGAFYGPKIDIMVRDAMGRAHQTATVQLDFNLPQRFGLHYVAEDGAHHTPVMIHRAALGSVERMMGILMEHYNGRWPFWLSPRQAVVIPAVTDAHVVEYALAVSKALAGAGVGWDAEMVRRRIVGEGRVGDAVFDVALAGARGGADTFFHVDARLHDVDATLGKRVRDAWIARYNFVVVVGQRELENGTVSLRMNTDADGVSGGKKDQNLGEKTLEDVVVLWNSLHPNAK